MRKFTVIFALAFLFVLGFNNTIVAQDDIEMDIDMFKDVYSHGEYYGIELDTAGNDVKNVKHLLIEVPNGKRMRLRNTLRLNDIALDACGMSYEEFKNGFPEGEYRIILFPRKYGELRVNMTHDFPQTPIINYPADGDTDVPLNLTIIWEPVIWEPVGDVGDVWVEIKGENPQLGEVALDFNVSSDSTSLAIPNGVLLPNSQHELWLTTKNNDLVTISRIIYFTTAAE